MSEQERRHGYNNLRVLIDAGRILTPQFADAVLFITGEQLEILRNLMLYVNRLSTFVDEYHEGYYLSPDSDDWDDIQAIVADLELKLMGNDNTIWGYKEQWSVQLTDDNADAGTNTMNSIEVPPGELWTVDLVQAVNNDNTGYFTFTIESSGGAMFLDYDIVKDAGDWHAIYPLGMKLAEGDTIIVYFYNCVAGDNLRVRILGTKMDVPV